MNANVNLHFKVRPNDNILHRSAQWNSQPILSIPGLRVHFSAQRFLNIPQMNKYKTLFNKITEYAKAQNFRVVIDKSLDSFKSFLTSDTKIDDDYAAELPSQIIYLYRDAVFGLPRIVELQKQGFEVASWDTLAVQFAKFIPKARMG